MTRGVWPLLAAALGGRVCAAQVANLTFFADVDPAGCTIGRSCTNGGIPQNRGVCVVSRTGSFACWDVCNPNHASDSFRANNNVMVTMTLKGMVETVRAGNNPTVSCPGFRGGDICPPGNDCPAGIAASYKVPEGRGMCVIDPDGYMSRACWDMCDTTILTSAFALGTPEGTKTKILNVRGSTACPRLQWWGILLTVLGVLGLIFLCVGLGIMLRRRAGSKSRESGELKDFTQGLHEEADEGMDQGDVYDRGLGDYQQEPAAEMMPPEPPRQDSIRPPVHDMPAYQPYYDQGSAGTSSYSANLPLPPATSSSPYSPSGRLQSMQQPSSPYSPGGRPIPGLQEPENLLNLTQQQLGQQALLGQSLAVPQQVVGYQASFTAPPMYGGLQMPQVGHMGGHSFHTVPPQSVQMTPGTGPMYFGGGVQSLRRG